jgi:hypothetical protein
MKCPKCGYISFDYNQACPKCNKDVSLMQEKLNIPAFKPDPPSLLGALLGGHETAASLNASGETLVIHQKTEMALGDSSGGIPSGGAALGDSQELDLSLELDEEQAAGQESPGAKEIGQEIPELKAEAEAISLNESAVFPAKGDLPAKSKRKEEAEEILFDLEDIAIESAKPEKDAGVGGDEKLEIELADLTLEAGGDDLKLEPVSPKEEQGPLDIGSLSLESQEGPAAEKKEEITLSLEDLQVNDTGELEISNSIHYQKSAGMPELMDSIALELDTPPASGGENHNEEDVRLVLGDETIEIPAKSAGGEHQIDLENLDIELDLDGPEHK